MSLPCSISALRPSWSFYTICILFSNKLNFHNTSPHLLPQEILKRLHLAFCIFMLFLFINNVMFSDPGILLDFYSHPPLLD